MDERLIELQVTPVLRWFRRRERVKQWNGVVEDEIVTVLQQQIFVKEGDSVRYEWRDVPTVIDDLIKRGVRT